MHSKVLTPGIGYFALASGFLALVSPSPWSPAGATPWGRLL